MMCFATCRNDAAAAPSLYKGRGRPQQSGCKLAQQTAQQNKLNQLNDLRVLAATPPHAQHCCAAGFLKRRAAEPAANFKGSV